ncbi:aminoglycoside phosphotransferase family protein [Aquihabitans sp. G128]|uniref:phosphotransferase family protein n=1 Tax=Aquihabitans sp. G128 TaxID=2849779 RepID=UPI001C21D737|nr:aminoglycoside phosphotransferase family protein [Aquihabitans sp. G128]QXC62633.1 aminoglycoside phosphotransferase family protein [Aquihabitans sp. G128]
MSEAPEIDEDEAGRLLIEHLGRTDVGPLELVGAGEWSQAFGFALDGRDLVVRFGRRGDDFEKDRRAAAVAAPGLPVPAVLGHGEIDGLHVAISTRARGVALESLDRAGWEAVLPHLLEALDALRATDVGDSDGRGRWVGDGVASHPSWPAYLGAVGDDGPDHRTPGWRDRLASSAVGTATFDAALARLDGLADACPPEEDAHLVHADLLNRNVLVDPATHRIDAVFDWGCALVGDHLYDLATLAFWSAWYEDLAAADVVAAATAHLTADGVVPRLADRMLACQLHVGLENLGYSAWSANAALPWIDARLASLL